MFPVGLGSPAPRPHWRGPCLLLSSGAGPTWLAKLSRAQPSVPAESATFPQSRAAPPGSQLSVPLPTLAQPNPRARPLRPAPPRPPRPLVPPFLRARGPPPPPIGRAARPSALGPRGLGCAALSLGRSGCGWRRRGLRAAGRRGWSAWPSGTGVRRQPSRPAVPGAGAEGQAGAAGAAPGEGRAGGRRRGWPAGGRGRDDDSGVHDGVLPQR